MPDQFDQVYAGLDLICDGTHGGFFTSVAETLHPTGQAFYVDGGLLAGSPW